MTAEIGEHERAPRACESYPTSLRATLRAPPSKWAIRAFFPAGERSEPRSRTARRAPADRSPRRIATWAASGVAVPRAFFGTFFRFERKYCPPRGGSPTVRAVVGASFPHWRKGDCACGRTKGLFFPPLETFGYRSCRETHRGKISNPRRSRPVKPSPTKNHPAGKLTFPPGDNDISKNQPFTAPAITPDTMCF